MTGAATMPPVAMNRGVTPIRCSATAMTNGSKSPMWLTASSSGPRRSSSGTAPVTSMAPKISTSQAKRRSTNVQNSHGGAAAIAISRANHSGSSEPGEVLGQLGSRRPPREQPPDRSGHRGVHCPRSSSSSRSMAGRSVMMPSTPRSSRAVHSAGSSTVQTCTCRPRS